MNSSEIRRCDAIRSKAYNDLCLGVRTNDKKLIDSAINKMSVCGSRRDQVGFSTADILEHFNRVDGKFNTLSSLLQYKQQALRNYYKTVSDSNGAGNTNASQRSALSHDIHDLGGSVRTLYSLLEILTDLLCNRGAIVSVMAEERCTAETVSVR
jgi:hypothetical protein